MLDTRLILAFGLSEFHEKYPTAQDVPEDQPPYLAYLQRVNQGMFDKAESLGWRPLQR